MKILYGVQGTGNGHVARARLFEPALARAGHEVDWLFSGRDPSGYFDMEPFDEARHFRGLGLVVEGGRIDRLATARHIRPLRLVRELSEVRPERYDLVLSDYEPLSAWAGRLKGVPVVGIGHQQAFVGTDAEGIVPEPDGDRLGRAVLRRFAPADVRLGMHWARFRPTILPPVVDTSLALDDDEGFTLVYRPFESSGQLVAELNRVAGRASSCSHRMSGPRRGSPTCCCARARTARSASGWCALRGSCARPASSSSARRCTSGCRCSPGRCRASTSSRRTRWRCVSWDSPACSAGR